MYVIMQPPVTEYQQMQTYCIQLAYQVGSHRAVAPRQTYYFFYITVHYTYGMLILPHAHRACPTPCPIGG